MQHWRKRLGMAWCLVLLVAFAAMPMANAEERITLEILLTAGRDPNVNVVQDYGEISWADILEQEFQKEYPHVDLVFRVGTLDNAIVEMAAGLGSDIINGAAADFVNLGRKGAFIDLAPLLERDGIDYMATQTFWPPQWEAFQYEGRQFALPQYLGTVAHYYNADMFADAGLADPEPRAEFNTTDWDEFEQILKRLTKDTDGDGVPEVWGFNKTMRANRIYYWMMAGGAELYGNEERTISTLDSPEALAALDYLRELRWDARVIPPPGVSVSWVNGDVAIYEDGSFYLSRYLGRTSSGNQKVFFRWNVMPLPLGPSGKRVTMATIDGYAINKNTKHLEEAYALVKFLAGPEANAIMAKYLALQPAHRDVVPEYISLMRELNTQAYDINVHVFTDAGPYAHPQTLYARQDVAGPLFQEAYKKIFDDNMPAALVWPDTIDRLNRVMASSVDEYKEEKIEWLGEVWTTRDFNTAMAGETFVREDGTLVVLGEGKDIWGSADGFRYVYKEVEGDFTATLRLDSVPDTHDWSKSGMMLRAAATDDAPNVIVVGTLKNGVVMQSRSVYSGSTKTVGRTEWTPGESVYLQVTRRGNKVTGRMSTDGNRWVELGSIEIDIAESVLVGPASTSHASALLGEAVFSDWELQVD